MKHFALFCLILFFIFASCSKRENVKEENNLGKYVYEDDTGIIHCSESCVKLKFGKDDNGHSIYAKHPIDTANFVLDEDNIRVCARCVSDEIYDRLLSISHRNNGR